MKKIILLLFFVSFSYAQWDGYGKWYDFKTRPAVTATPYIWDTEATTYFAALSTALSDSQQININDFVIDLKDSLSTALLSSYFDVFCISANETKEAALTNFIKPGSYNSTLVGAPALVFTAFRGFTGETASKYINTNYNASTNATVYAINSASFGIYFWLLPNYSTYEFHGAYSTTADGGATKRIQLINPNGFYDRFAIALNSDAATLTSSDSILGSYIGSRTASNVLKLYVNGAEKISASTVSTGIPNQTVYINALHNIDTNPLCYSNDVISMYFLGKGLTQIEARKISNCFEKYMDSIGSGRL